MTFLSYCLQVEEPAKGSYGLNVARLAGLDVDLLRVAAEKANWMHGHTITAASGTTVATSITATAITAGRTANASDTAATATAATAASAAGQVGVTATTTPSTATAAAPAQGSITDIRSITTAGDSSGLIRMGICDNMKTGIDGDEDISVDRFTKDMKHLVSMICSSCSENERKRKRRDLGVDGLINEDEAIGVTSEKAVDNAEVNNDVSNTNLLKLKLDAIFESAKRIKQARRLMVDVDNNTMISVDKQ
jgi:hypothetical protein